MKGPFLLKSYANYLCIPLDLVFRNCLRDGFVPDDWKFSFSRRAIDLAGPVIIVQSVSLVLCVR